MVYFLKKEKYSEYWYLECCRSTPALSVLCKVQLCPRFKDPSLFWEKYVCRIARLATCGDCFRGARADLAHLLGKVAGNNPNILYHLRYLIRLLILASSVLIGVHYYLP